jgi:hypothetical protein
VEVTPHRIVSRFRNQTSPVSLRIADVVRGITLRFEVRLWCWVVFLKRSAITEAVYSKDGNCAMKIIITGTAGFIGPPVCRHPPRKTNAEFARRPEVVAT